jgi:hypothetical protein
VADKYPAAVKIADELLHQGRFSGTGFSGDEDELTGLTRAFEEAGQGF